jgi:hypothetical protein
VNVASNRTGRGTFAVRLVPEPGVDGIKSFRALLKVALRRFGLRAIDAREICEPNRENDMSEFAKRIRSQKKGTYKVADLEGDKEITLTISHLLESVAMFNKEVDLLCFKETGQQLQLNQTTSEFLIKALGDDPETWEGKKVVLYLAPYEYEGETKMGVRLKLPAAPASGDNTAAPAQHKADLDDGIPF